MSRRRSPTYAEIEIIELSTYMTLHTNKPDPVQRRAVPVRVEEAHTLVAAPCCWVQACAGERWPGRFAMRETAWTLWSYGLVEADAMRGYTAVLGQLRADIANGNIRAGAHGQVRSANVLESAVEAELRGFRARVLRRLEAA